MDGQYSPTLKPTDSIYMTYSFILSLVHMDRHTITWWFFFSFSSGDEVQLAGHGCNKIDPETQEKRMANFVWLLHSFTLLFGFDFLFGNCDDMYRFFNYVLNVMHDRFPQFHMSLSFFWRIHFVWIPAEIRQKKKNHSSRIWFHEYIMKCYKLLFPLSLFS